MWWQTSEVASPGHVPPARPAALKCGVLTRPWGHVQCHPDLPGTPTRLPCVCSLMGPAMLRGRGCRGGSRAERGHGARPARGPAARHPLRRLGRATRIRSPVTRRPQGGSGRRQPRAGHSAGRHHASVQEPLPAKNRQTDRRNRPNRSPCPAGCSEAGALPQSRATGPRLPSLSLSLGEVTVFFKDQLH